MTSVCRSEKILFFLMACAPVLTCARFRVHLYTSLYGCQSSVIEFIHECMSVSIHAAMIFLQTKSRLWRLEPELRGPDPPLPGEYQGVPS